MIVRTLQGVAFECISPSFYKLAGYPVDISYLDDAWYLHCPGRDGEPAIRRFESRDSAVAFIAEAFRNQGRIA